MKDVDFARLTKSIMKANNWDEEYTRGYLDGVIKRFFGFKRKKKSYLNGRGTRNYLYGYRKGYNETLI